MTATKKPTKAEERARVERALVRRVLKIYDQQCEEWRERVEYCRRDHARYPDWVEGEPLYDPNIGTWVGNGLGLTVKDRQGSLRVLSFARIEKMAERDAGPRPDLRTLLEEAVK